MRIAIIEDEPEWLTKIEKVLGFLKHEVVLKYGQTKGAVEAIRNAKPDLVLVDIELNDDKEGGIEVAKELSRYEIPFVYLTQHNDIHTFNEAHNSNIVNALQLFNKPIFNTHKIEYKLEEVEETVQKIFIIYNSKYRKPIPDENNIYPQKITKIEYQSKKCLVYQEDCTKPLAIKTSLNNISRQYSTLLHYANDGELINLKKVTKVDIEKSKSSGNKYTFHLIGTAEKVIASFRRGEELYKEWQNRYEC